MPMRYKTAFLCALIVLTISLTGCLGGDDNTPPNNNPPPLDDATAFEVVDTDGNTFNLTGKLGKVVVLDFMGIGCQGCDVVEDMLKQIAQEFPNVVIISIDVWDHVDSDQDLADHKAAENVTWTMALAADDVADKYDVVDLPRLIIVNKEGKIAYDEIGVVQHAVFRIEVGKLI